MWVYRSVFEPPVLVSGVLFQWPNRPGRRQIRLGGDVELGSVPWMKDRPWRLGTTPWKINGWNLQPSPMKRKENDLKTNLQGIMVHVNLPGCIRCSGWVGDLQLVYWGYSHKISEKPQKPPPVIFFCIVFFLLFGAFLDGHSGHRKFG